MLIVVKNMLCCNAAGNHMESVMHADKRIVKEPKRAQKELKAED